MNPAATFAKETESGFLAGVQAKLAEAAARGQIAGSWFKREEHDEQERLCAAMIDRRIFDHAQFAEFPHGRGFSVRGFERRWIFGKRLRSVTVATVLAPPEPLLASDGPVPPVTLGELTEHVRKLVVDAKAPHLIGVCSPSGFAPEVWNTPPDLPNVQLVLVAPRSGGGWRVENPGGKLPEALRRLFDAEDVQRKLARVRQAIESHRGDLLLGGLTAENLSRELGLSAEVVAQGFEQAAKASPELHVTKQGGEVMLYVGAAEFAGVEESPMSIIAWIKDLFSREGDERKKINLLRARRASLSGKLDELRQNSEQLEKKEQGLTERGRAASSQVAKRGLAGEILRVRQEISRCNTTAAIFNKQINIISTHIHNLELARTGSAVQIPSSEELTEAAVNAEEIIEELAASDQLVSGLEVSMAGSTMSEEEAAILAELQGDAGKSAAKAGGEKAAGGADQTKAAEPGERGAAQAE